MGFIHDTKSEIFGVETRNESALLHDLSESTAHLFLRFSTKSQIRDEIADSILKQAGEFYGNGDSTKAAEYKKLSEIVRQTAVSYDPTPYTFEATFEWIAELVKFFNDNKKFIEKFSNNLAASSLLQD